MRRRFLYRALLILALTPLGFPLSVFGVLTCSATTTCPSGTVIWRMASTSNSHVELASQALYAQLVCCSGVSGLGNSCSGTFATALKLAATTNSHAEQGTQSNYAHSACISVPTGNTVTIAYQASNCTGYDTTLGSISNVTNAHVGDANAFPTKICAKISLPQSLSFALSTTTVSFGNLDQNNSRYASSTAGAGAAAETEAHSFTVNTNAAAGYVVTVQGSSLANGTNIIHPIGAVNSTPTPGSEQFGLRIVPAGGSGSVTAPYAAAGFAYAASSTVASQVASESVGDGVDTVYSVRYVANIAPTTKSISYSTNITYVATANF